MDTHTRERSAFRYCTIAESVDPNPFRYIEHSELSYIYQFIRPMVGSESEEPVLEKLSQFPSPSKSTDEVSIKGVLSSNLMFPDSSKVLAKDVAYSIAKVIYYRTQKESFWVKGSESINAPGWHLKEYEGIKVLNDREFILTFVSKVSNLIGVLREALSNRGMFSLMAWPVSLAHVDPQC